MGLFFKTLGWIQKGRSYFFGSTRGGSRFFTILRTFRDFFSDQKFQLLYGLKYYSERAEAANVN